MDLEEPEFEMLPVAVKLEEEASNDASETKGEVEDDTEGLTPDSIQHGAHCSAVDLSHNNKRDPGDEAAGKSKLPRSLESIKQGSAFSNSFSPQSFSPSLEAFMGNPHLMQALAAFAFISGADSGGVGGVGIAELLPKENETRSQDANLRIRKAPSPVLPPRRSSREKGVSSESANSGAKPPKNKKPDQDATAEMLYCSFCDYSCTLKCTLNVHMMKHDSSKQFTCSECNYTTSRSSDLKKHFRIHTGEKPFKCELCDYKSTEQGALRKHMLTHNCDNPHCCPHCDYVSPRIGDLKRHMHIHSDKKPHACQHCDYKAAQLQHLRKHMLIHTGLKPYQCTYCDYRCREPRNLKTHIQTHTGEKPYSCPHCQYKAGRLGTLRRHITSIHPSDDSLVPALPRHFLEGGADEDEQLEQEVS